MGQQQQTPGLPYSPISRNLGERNSAQQTQPFTQPQDIKYSPKHTGLYLYLVRLLRPIWKKKCIVSMDGVSSLTHENCSEILTELYALKAFLEDTPLNNFSGGIFASSESLDNLLNLNFFNRNVHSQRYKQ